MNSAVTVQLVGVPPVPVRSKAATGPFRKESFAHFEMALASCHVKRCSTCCSGGVDISPCCKQCNACRMATCESCVDERGMIVTALALAPAARRASHTSR